MNKRNKVIPILVLVCALLLTSCSTKANVTKTSNINGPLLPAYSLSVSSKKWGYVDSTGKFVISPKYDSAMDFQSNNIAIVTVNNKYGLINKNGTTVLPISYDYITNFSEGYAVATKDSTNFLIDEKGKTIYSSTSPIMTYSDGMCLFSKNINGQSLYGYLDKTGKVKLDAKYLNAEPFNGDKALVETSDNKYHLIDTNGNIITSYSFNDLYSYSDDTIVYNDSKTSLNGYINANGTVIVPAKFEEADPFKDGFAIVAVSSGNYQPPKYGIINKSGNYVVTPQYTSITYLGNGLFSVTKTGDTTNITFQPAAIINSSGTLLTDFKYYGVGSFSNGYASVSDNNSTYFINTKGQAVSTLPKFSGNGTLNLNGNIIEANIDNRLSYVTKANKVIWMSNNIYNLNNGISVSEVKYRPNRLNLIYYPQISGIKNSSAEASINNELKNDFIGSVKATDPNTDTTIDFLASQNKNLLIIEQTGYIYPIGAAHGMPVDDYFSIDLNTGKFYKLSDLFKPGSSYANKINNLIKADIKANNSQYFPDAFTGITADQSFHVTKDSLVIYFSPYEIAPYAAGYPSFNISWKDLMDVINTDGSFFKAFDKNTNGSIVNNSASESDIKNAIDTYENTLVSAINNHDFSIVSPILYNGSNLYKDQENLITSLSKQGITETFGSFTLDKVEFNSNKTECKAYVDETVTINYPKKATVTKQYSYIYTLNYSKVLSKWQLSDIATWKK